MKGYSHGQTGPLDRAEATRQSWRSQVVAPHVHPQKKPWHNRLALLLALLGLACLLKKAWCAGPKKPDIQKMIIKDENLKNFMNQCAAYPYCFQRPLQR